MSVLGPRTVSCLYNTGVWNDRKGNQLPHFEKNREREREENSFFPGGGESRLTAGKTLGMDTERRKRQGPNGDHGRRARARGDDAAKAGSEEDVEEFFAILRRMHAATRYLGNGKGGNGRDLTESGRRWRPAFEWEDFEGGNGVKSRGEEKGKGDAMVVEEGEKKERREAKCVIRELDLNAEPEPENAAHSSG